MSINIKPATNTTTHHACAACKCCPISVNIATTTVCGLATDVVIEPIQSISAARNNDAPGANAECVTCRCIALVVGRPALRVRDRDVGAIPEGVTTRSAWHTARSVVTPTSRAHGQALFWIGYRCDTALVHRPGTVQIAAHGHKHATPIKVD